MNKHITTVFPVLLAAAGAAFAQQGPEQVATVTQPPAAAATQPPAAVALAAPQAPEGRLAPASYEEQLRAAEARFPLKLPTAKLSVKTYINGAPWLAYAIAYDRVMEAKAKSGDTAAGAPEIASMRGGPLGGLSTVGAFVASDMASFGSAARTNWAYAGFGIALLDLLSGPSAAQKAISQHRTDGLLKPAIHFITQEPGAFKQDNGYRVIAETHAVINGLGLECQPAFLHAPIEQPPFIGGTNARPAAYFRNYACGFGANEKVQQQAIAAEIKSVLLNSYPDAEPIMQFSLSNLPAMSNMKRVLGVTDEAGEKNMGRLAYERVRGKVPADWTVVYTAPDESGKWMVFVSRNGIVEAFDAPEKL